MLLFTYMDAEVEHTDDSPDGYQWNRYVYFPSPPKPDSNENHGKGHEPKREHPFRSFPLMRAGGLWQEALDSRCPTG